LRFNLFLKLLK